MDTVGSRVRQVREALGISRPQLSKMTGIGYSTLSELERGGMQTTTKLRLIASALNVDQTWLETGKGHSAQFGDWVDVPLYAQCVGAGAGTEVQPDAEALPARLRADALRRHGLLNHRLAIYVARGDSMEPRIHSGDELLFDQDDTILQHGGIYIVLWRGEAYVKRVLLADDIALAASDNPNGDHIWGRPKQIHNAREPVEIVGRVRRIYSWED